MGIKKKKKKMKSKKREMERLALNTTWSNKLKGYQGVIFGAEKGIKGRGNWDGEGIIEMRSQIINSTAAEKDTANDWTRIRPHLHNMEEKGFPWMDQDILRHRSPESSSWLLVSTSHQYGKGGHESMGGW
ncbi:hypothetical protein CEXT_747391 [Caerostris extrusa]|uniref:Uncharacterized protein n=1 Tax=Caerostris extrusa TaxID=172846 RepID=A0AAV4S3N6_CAEEX|nr:hypothetical protein CEXT_747391 [Caerostris extrusa]